MTTVGFLVAGLWTVVLILGGVSAAVGYVRSRRRRESGPVLFPVGLELVACAVSIDPVSGREVHTRPRISDGGGRCWVLTCAECGSPFPGGVLDVHFVRAVDAIDAVQVDGGWAQVENRMRCGLCVECSRFY